MIIYVMPIRFMFYFVECSRTAVRRSIITIFHHCKLVFRVMINIPMNKQ